MKAGCAIVEIPLRLRGPVFYLRQIKIQILTGFQAFPLLLPHPSQYMAGQNSNHSMVFRFRDAQ